MDIQKTFDQAFQLHQSGQLKDALDLYEQVQASLDNNPQFLFLFGTLLGQIGQLESAIEILDKSIQLNSLNPGAFYNRGKFLQELNRLGDSVLSYDRAIALKPDFIDAYINRGNALKDLKRLCEALQSYEKAIALKPDYAEAYSNRGVALQDLKRLDDALLSYDKAIALKPDYADAYYNRGNTLRDLKRLDEALLSYDKAIALKPDYADAYSNRGNALRELKRLDEALLSYDKAIALKPDYADAYSNRGNALRELKRLDEAVASYDKAIALKPDYAEAYSNRGVALRELKRLDEAVASYDKAITLKADYAEAYYNRGIALKELKRLDEALTSYDKAITLKADYAEAYWNKSLLHILTGNYLDGWENYEWRLQKDDTSKDYYKFSSAKLSWRGKESIENKRVLIYSEQGFGDVIQFCRYMPQVKYLGADIIFEVPKALVSFVSTLNCNMTVIAKGDPHPEFHTYCPVMSLPYIFKTTVETIPADIPYLYAKKEKVANWREKLGQKDRLRVGLVWSGSTIHKNDINRSIPLEKLLTLFDLPIDLHSLQKEYRKDDLKLLNEHPEIHQHQDDLKDFSDTAALAECMDLVISVDTSVAHVAGSIGKPVWILLPYVPDYRWMLDRDDSPWYPTARLFRQPQFDDWQSAIHSVREGLTQFIVQNHVNK